jgi:hypothetical protein
MLMVLRQTNAVAVAEEHPTGPSDFEPPKSFSSTSDRTYKRSPMIAACAFCAEGGNCFSQQR